MYTQIEQVRAYLLQVLFKAEQKLHLRVKNGPNSLDNETLVRAKALEHKHRMYHIMEKVQITDFDVLHCKLRTIRGTEPHL